MQPGKKDREAFVEFGLEAGTYDKNYSDSPDRYPDHVFRLRIFLDLLKKFSQSLYSMQVAAVGCRLQHF